METNENKQRVALQLVGSPTSRFYFELSVLYARPVVRPVGFELVFLVCYPGGGWSFSSPPAPPRERGQTSGAARWNLTVPREERISFSDMLTGLPQVDVVVPHLFCPAGLTVYRSFFERVLGLPVVGSPGEVLHIAQHKQLTRLVALDHGVRVAPGRLLGVGEDPAGVAAALGFPLIVKPNETDNSDGVALVHNAADLAGALVRARGFNERCLVEAYIPGREIRGAVVELNGELIALPFIEYLVGETHPIRLAADKLTTDDDGSVTGQSAKKNIPAVCPADLDEALTEQLSDMMRRMHRALGCRDFSLFDFRVHEQTGVPYLLEAGLFWSFGEISMVSGMLQAAGLDLEEVTGEIWRRAENRRASAQRAAGNPL